MTTRQTILDSTKLHIFAYGSNMAVARMRERIASAAVIDTGFIAGRKLAFHKRSDDGSAKANALQTGNEADQVWGVLYRIGHRDKVILDRLESEGHGYDREEVEVVISETPVPVYTYVARKEAIDESLKPYSWYHQLVLHGAVQHGLPDAYINELAKFETIADPDRIREQKHRSLLSH